MIQNSKASLSFVSLVVGNAHPTVSQFVIPAKSRKAGREPGSRKNLIILNFHWIPDLAPQSGARPE